MDIDESEFDREEGKTHHQSHCDSQLHRLMELVKEKCEISSNYDYSLLSPIPGRSSKPAKSSVFLIDRLVKQARQHKKEKGILVSLKERKDVLSIWQQYKELERFMKTMNTRECARPRRNLYLFE